MNYEEEGGTYDSKIKEKTGGNSVVTLSFQKDKRNNCINTTLVRSGNL